MNPNQDNSIVGYIWGTAGDVFLRDLRARANRQKLWADFEAYLDSFSPGVQNIVDSFEFRSQIPHLSNVGTLGTLIEKLPSQEINLSPAGIEWKRPLRKNLGKKNCELDEAGVQRITEVFLAFKETEQSKIFDNAAFDFWKVTVEPPLGIEDIDTTRANKPAEIKALKVTGSRGENAPPLIKKTHKKGTEADPLRGRYTVTQNGKPAMVEYEPVAELRDTEQIPLLDDSGIEAFLQREVLPHAADAEYVESSVKIGYAISFTRCLDKPTLMRSQEEIHANSLALEQETVELLEEIIGEAN